MVVIDPSKFMPVEEFTARVDDMLDEFKACPPAAGVERVLIPGEIEADRERESMEKGIELSDPVVEELRRVGAEYGVSASF